MECKPLQKRTKIRTRPTRCGARNDQSTTPRPVSPVALTAFGASTRSSLLFHCPCVTSLWLRQSRRTEQDEACEGSGGRALAQGRRLHAVQFPLHSIALPPLHGSRAGWVGACSTAAPGHGQSPARRRPAACLRPAPPICTHTAIRRAQPSRLHTQPKPDFTALRHTATPTTPTPAKPRTAALRSRATTLPRSTGRPAHGYSFGAIVDTTRCRVP
jgi:hypothetical protein